MSYDITKINIENVDDDAQIKPLQVNKLNTNEDRVINKVFNVYHVRALVCGSSGSGKTTFILNYLFQNLDTYGLVIYCAPTETLESGMIKSIIQHGKEVKELFGLNHDLNKYFFPLDIRNDE